MTARKAHKGRPFTGAWIETWLLLCLCQTDNCRPFTGAWIETHAAPAREIRASVAPSRGRGLKPEFPPSSVIPTFVAPSRGRGLKRSYLYALTKKFGSRPFTGAWIETLKAVMKTADGGRPFTGAWIETPTSRHQDWKTPVAPSRGRGLKRRRHVGGRF